MREKKVNLLYSLIYKEDMTLLISYTNNGKTASFFIILAFLIVKLNETLLTEFS